MQASALRFRSTLAARVGLEGVIILRTIPDSPADRAGLKGIDINAGTVGDVIVAVNGKSVRRLSDLTEVLEGITVPGKVELVIKRDDVKRTISVDVVDIGGG